MAVGTNRASHDESPRTRDGWRAAPRGRHGMCRATDRRSGVAWRTVVIRADFLPIA